MYRFGLRDMLRQMFGSNKKRSAVETDLEAYEFCLNAYKETGGVNPELRRAFEFYQSATAGDCGRQAHRL